MGKDHEGASPEQTGPVGPKESLRHIWRMATQGRVAAVIAGHRPSIEGFESMMVAAGTAVQAKAPGDGDFWRAFQQIEAAAKKLLPLVYNHDDKFVTIHRICEVILHENGRWHLSRT